MKIFSNFKQAIVFAFHLQARPGELGVSDASMVKRALNDAAVNVPGALLDAATLDMIGEFAPKLCDAVTLGLPRYEAQALIAAYSLSWADRRAAVDILQPYFRPALAPYADDPRLIERMVTRHYLVSRERNEGWGVHDISRSFGAAVERVANIGAAVERLALQLEADALALLAIRVNLPTLEAVDA